MCNTCKGSGLVKARGREYRPHHACNGNGCEDCGWTGAVWALVKTKTDICKACVNMAARQPRVAHPAGGA